MMQVSAHVAHEMVGDQVVLLDLQLGRYFSLEGSGARIWQLITEGSNETEIVAQLLSEYAVERSQLQRDVVQLKQDLIKHGLIGDQAENHHRSQKKI